MGTSRAMRAKRPFTSFFVYYLLGWRENTRTFAGLLSFVDMNSKTTHTDALFGYSNSVVRSHFKSNRLLDVDCTLRNCYQSFSVSFK